MWCDSRPLAVIPPQLSRVVWPWRDLSPPAHDDARGRTTTVHGRTTTIRGRTATVHGRTTSVHGRTATVRGRTTTMQPRTMIIHGRTRTMHARTATVRGRNMRDQGRHASVRGSAQSTRTRIRPRRRGRAQAPPFPRHPHRAQNPDLPAKPVRSGPRGRATLPRRGPARTPSARARPQDPQHSGYATMRRVVKRSTRVWHRYRARARARPALPTL